MKHIDKLAYRPQAERYAALQKALRRSFHTCQFNLDKGIWRPTIVDKPSLEIIKGRIKTQGKFSVKYQLAIIFNDLEITEVAWRNEPKRQTKERNERINYWARELSNNPPGIGR